jgi:hypothetical protein
MSELTYEGKFYQYKEVPMTMAPLQTPHPAIVVRGRVIPTASAGVWPTVATWSAMPPWIACVSSQTVTVQSGLLLATAH